MKKEESGEKSKSQAAKGDEQLFICPMCESEHAVPGEKSGVEQMCPKCAVPLKEKQKKY